MMFLKEFIANANAVVFPFIFRKCKFCAFSCDSGHEHPWPLFMCFPVLKARGVYWSATALRSPGKPQAVTSLVTVTPQDRMLPAPGKGQQKGKCTLALRLLSSQTKPQLKIDLCLMWQAGIWLAKAHTCPLLHPVLGSCSAAREAVSATFNSLSR